MQVKFYLRTDQEEENEQLVFMMQVGYEEASLLFQSLVSSIISFSAQPLTQESRKMLTHQRNLLGYWLGVAWDREEPELVFDLSMSVSEQAARTLQAFANCLQVIGDDDLELYAVPWERMCEVLKKQADDMSLGASGLRTE